jgi:hypothetical protein
VREPGFMLSGPLLSSAPQGERRPVIIARRVPRGNLETSLPHPPQARFIADPDEVGGMVALLRQSA